MGRFLNPDYSAFETALNSEIYIDKTGLLAYTNKVINTKQAFIYNQLYVMPSFCNPIIQYIYDYR